MWVTPGFGKKSGLVDVWLSEISDCSKIPDTSEQYVFLI